jgi:hypothetical protein
MTNKESQTVEYKQSWRNDCLKAVSSIGHNGHISDIVINMK